jgi:FKBP-type peptidyl-prolyl cis-trans isomerase FklB
MKIKGLIIVSVAVALMLDSCAQSTVKNAKIVTKLDSLSYAFGVYFATSLMQDSIELNPILVAKALLDGKEGKLLMEDNIARGFIYAYMNEKDQAKRAKEAELNKVRYKDAIAQGDSFLQKNKERPGVLVTASGLQYEVIKMGTGPKPTPTSEVKVHYKGTLMNGTQFDASDPKNPVQFLVTGVIKGWTEALQLMPVGSIFKLYIPQDLAYGADGAGDVIKPYSTLIFEVELLEIVK